MASDIYKCRFNEIRQLHTVHDGGGKVITMDTAGYTDLEPPFQGVLRNLHVFPVRRLTGGRFSNGLEKVERVFFKS